MSGMFLDDGIDNIVDQKEKEAKEVAKKKAAGMVKVRALDPRTNKTVVTWIKKDDATLEWEKEEAQKQALAKRQSDVELKVKKLEMLKREKELADKESELAKLEAELLANSEVKKK